MEIAKINGRRSLFHHEYGVRMTLTVRNKYLSRFFNQVMRKHTITESYIRWIGIKRFSVFTVPRFILCRNIHPFARINVMLSSIQFVIRQ